jgi:1-acyl-sn-glycerol-3-phosphate acyltransferase
MSAPQDIVERPLQFQGSALARRLLRWWGWEVDFDGLPSRQGVLAVYPHTSNWDFIVGILAKWSMGIQVKVWAKASLFKVPVFGPWLAWLGGIPVDRTSPHGLVGDMVRRMQDARDRQEMLWLVVAPEGTRSAGDGWKSGFYQVALASEVPLGLAYLDFGRKRVGVHSFIALTGDVDSDMSEIARRLSPAVGCRPANAAPIRLKK